MDTLRKWKAEHILRNRYCIPSRLPFFKLAGKYLPAEQDSIVVDIGAGDGAFATFLEFKEKFTHHVLLDSNKESVTKLKDISFNAEYYHAPEKLPFPDGSVSFIHLSHIVEHLPYEELYLFLKEMDRVVKNDGVIVISTPLLWNRFYDDLSHVKPYNPPVFINYLTRSKDNATQSTVSEKYIVRELQYRYRVTDGSVVQFSSMMSS
jgi:ubiquinone/menaquinone biosynthesis C-methylase UbiE